MLNRRKASTILAANIYSLNRKADRAALSHSMRNEVFQEPIPADDLYESEWDDPMVNRAVSPNKSAAVDPYDCGWEDTMHTEASPMNISSEESWWTFCCFNQN